ncbi:serine/threonine-protein kinase [Actinomadura sp. NPDC047616]|uniref:serine/threonine-protein kinase n=1 Tax=Actinomadura sp. NPDC047616 TaxID=3155914 RepID=UPI003408A0D2
MTVENAISWLPGSLIISVGAVRTVATGQVVMESLRPSDPRDIGGIALHGRLGEGGMGAVYFGITAEGQPVAVKVIRKDFADHQELRERFDREIEAMEAVQGPRVASLVAASDPGDEQPWLAMEYVRGLTLRQFVDEHGELTADMGAALGDFLAEGVAAIHAAKLFHRDLKPANILLGLDGPKVIDFGLVALAEAEHHLTATGMMLGTPLTSAPEQVESPKNAGAAADVYSLGATLLYALARHYPYERPTVPALLRAITDRDTAPDLSGVPPTLEPVIAAMLAFAPEARPTLAEAADEFQQVYGVAGLSRRDARIHLATLTYVARPSDPPTDLDPPRPRPARSARRETRPATPMVKALAERLENVYQRAVRL